MGIGLPALFVVLVRAQVVDEPGLGNQIARFLREEAQLPAHYPVSDGSAPVAGNSADVVNIQQRGLAWARA